MSMEANKAIPAIDVQDLTVSLDNHLILDNLSFTIPQGQVAAVIGPNGAGKSVLVKTILNLLPKQKGTVNILGINHEKYRKVAPLISYVPQRLNFEHDFPLTVKGLFSLKSSRPIGMRLNEKERMMELLTMVNMEQYVDQNVNALSGGQLQRVLIAYSLMDNPQILILDEPSAGIDIKGQGTIYSLLKKIQTEKKLTMILVSHELDIVMQYADQVLCVNKTLLCAGVPHEVLSNDMLANMYGAPVQHFHHTHN